jgi:hypothetical protein
LCVSFLDFDPPFPFHLSEVLKGAANQNAGFPGSRNS